CHLLLERGRRRWFFEARDRAPPLRARRLRSAPIAQRAVGACFLRCAVNVGANTVVTIQQRMVGKGLSGWTRKPVLRGIVRKRAGEELGVPAMRIAFHGPPTVLPRPVEV